VSMTKYRRRNLQRLAKTKRKWAPAINFLLGERGFDQLSQGEKYLKTFDALQTFHDKIEEIMDDACSEHPEVIATPIITALDPVLAELEEYIDWLDEKIY